MLTGGFRTFVTSVIVAATVAAAGLAGPGAGTANAATASGTISTTISTSTRVVVQTLLESAVLTLTNVRRAAVGCRPLRFNRELRTAARRHSARMAYANTMSHQLAGEPRLGRRVTQAGYRRWRIVAENIAVGFTQSKYVMGAWWASPSHRRNITDCRLRELGVGVVVLNGQTWWTQNFGRRR